jgi:aspartyl-tRNA(Asn)/glutamyl-tRNA(Gln) amidotransferase subunit A
MSRDAVLASLRAHDVSAAWNAYDRVQAGPEGLNAFLSTDRAARTLATDGSLAGVPVAIKDNLATLGLPTTCGSRMLEGYVSPFEATAVRRLREAGAVVIGKTNMDEFAMGSSNENSAYGPVRNPLDPSRVPGGSSGGSAAAVAAGVVRMALGSETGGSVRQPAAFCGIVGIKPTYGRVSRYGLVAYASSLDNVGVFGSTVGEAALGLEIISGHDRFDATSADVAVPSMVPEPESTRSASAPLAGLVVGVPREYFPDSLDADVAAACRRALDHLRSLGAELREVSLPSTDLAIPVYYIIAPAEASSNLARYDGVRFGQRATADDLGPMYEHTRSHGFGSEVKRRILLGTYVLSAGYYDAYYKRAQAVRSMIAQEFRTVFASGVDLLFTPTAPTPAFRLGELSDPYEMYLSDIYTVTANLAGIPAMSLPIGRVRSMPVGGQLLAPAFGEAGMIRAAAALEQSLGSEAHR